MGCLDVGSGGDHGEVRAGAPGGRRIRACHWRRSSQVRLGRPRALREAADLRKGLRHHGRRMLWGNMPTREKSPDPAVGISMAPSRSSDVCRRHDKGAVVMGRDQAAWLVLGIDDPGHTPVAGCTRVPVVTVTPKRDGSPPEPRFATRPRHRRPRWSFPLETIRLADHQASGGATLGNFMAVDTQLSFAGSRVALVSQQSKRGSARPRPHRPCDHIGEYVMKARIARFALAICTALVLIWSATATQAASPADDEGAVLAGRGIVDTSTITW